ncbi:hypothetical protein FZEAL_8855 [Fusarium zealandicum]|uniref:Uncharacterized protein n=1 Tax=Fusarium zealandicum TaxID=1053134 RepID=A0A8H4UDR1_9HYPO|nr:hypothetical protein FZEAL_8855 [Fusarium zealandicum]
MAESLMTKMDLQSLGMSITETSLPLDTVLELDFDHGCETPRHMTRSGQRKRANQPNGPEKAKKTRPQTRSNKKHDDDQSKDVDAGGRYPKEDDLGVVVGEEGVDMKLACYLYKHDPQRYSRCSKYIDFSRAHHVKQHMRRAHQVAGPYYCCICRAQWPPAEPSSEDLWRAHIGSNCQALTTIEEAGVLLPAEIDDLKPPYRLSEPEKWNWNWKKLIPGLSLPGSPYMEDAATETAAALRRKAETVVKTVLNSSLSSRGIILNRDDVVSIGSELLVGIFGGLPTQTPAYSLMANHGQAFGVQSRFSGAIEGFLTPDPPGPALQRMEPWTVDAGAGYEPVPISTLATDLLDDQHQGGGLLQPWDPPIPYEPGAPGQFGWPLQSMDRGYPGYFS